MNDFNNPLLCHTLAAFCDFYGIPYVIQRSGTDIEKITINSHKVTPKNIEHVLSAALKKTGWDCIICDDAIIGYEWKVMESDSDHAEVLTYYTPFILPTDYDLSEEEEYIEMLYRFLEDYDLSLLPIFEEHIRSIAYSTHRMEVEKHEVEYDVVLWNCREINE